MRKFGKMRSVQYEILNPPHHCGAEQEECKELSSSKFVQRTTDKSGVPCQGGEESLL